LKISVYWGCLTLTSEYACELSTRKVLSELGIELEELSEYTCCGHPMKSINLTAALYLAARSMALAEKNKTEILISPCSKCYETFKWAEDLLKKDESLKKKIDNILKEENLSYNGEISIIHMIDLLYDYVGVEKLKEKIKFEFEGLKVAAHPGCYAFRIDGKTGLKRISKFDALIEVLGANSIYYAGKLDCCGGNLRPSRPEAALTLAGEKLNSAIEFGAGCLVDFCPHCHEMLDYRQEEASATIGKKLKIPVIYYMQLLGISFGIKPEELGIQLNKSGVEELIKKLNVF